MKNRGMLLAPLLALFFTVAHCGGEKPQGGDAEVKTTATAPAALPSIAAAAALISNSPEYSDYEFTSAGWALPLEKQFLNPPAMEAARQLEKEGWVTIDESGSVELTDKAKQDRRFLVRSNGFVDIVPLARKEFGGIASVRPGPAADRAEADFNWRWVPNDIGSTFTSGMLHERFAGEQAATAHLQQTKSGWQILEITAR